MENDITYDQMSSFFQNTCSKCIWSIVYDGRLCCNCPLNLRERFISVDYNTVICNHFYQKPKGESDVEEPTWEQVQEYCRKRGLVMITEDSYQILRSGLGQETNRYKTRIRQLMMNKEESDGEYE